MTTNSISYSSLGGGIEPLLTIADAAKALGVHTWALRRAVKSGTVPAYTPFNGRKTRPPFRGGRGDQRLQDHGRQR